MTTPLPERLEELLLTRATAGLPPQERQDLEEMLTDYPEWQEEGLEKAAAAVHLALVGKEEPMPPHLARRLAIVGRREVAGPAAAEDAQGDSRPAAVSPARLGWWVAAAAALLAVVGWWPRAASESIVPTSVPAATVAEQRDALLGEVDALGLDWTATEDEAAAGAGGSVVWSGDQQRGYMTFRGLAANDPAVSQYQLWIFDRAGDERYPVDGGVFDIPAGGGEIVVEIDAKLAVQDPYLFAVTVEKPGGVVVSSRERIVLVAQT